ncbi:hypothetical protein NERG_02733 [Nematocida ausubeli]|uniref:Uncharacterized protein n=1 Tax=Nematocida ausubeli (strain ATCC PRA-371 / ERTm2) TaxID=1913371 RepID=H8ZGL2_NEMA1|nr:hypothetical protein NERG_02733 [Nematocida ausubeli]
MYSDDELWVVDSSLCKIAGYMIEYSGCEDADAAEDSTADDRKIQFKRPGNIIVEEIPNTSYKEIQAITRHLIYERIKEAQKKRRDRIIIVVKNEADEEEYVAEYQKMSFIDNVSFEKHPNCFSSTNGIQRVSKQTNDSWTIGVCAVDKLKLAHSKHNANMYIFSGFTKNRMILPESILKMINTKVIIYEKPNVADYIKLRYM